MAKKNAEERRKAERLKEYLKKIAAAKKCGAEGLLAIDPANACGWACSDGTWGLWQLHPRKNESIGMKWIRFRRILSDFIDANGIKVVAYEAPSGRHTNAVIHHAKLAEIIEEECESKGIPYIGYNVKSIKQFATNNGNAGKPQMIAAAQKFFGYTGEDDNEADAICLLNLLKSET